MSLTAMPATAQRRRRPRAQAVCPECQHHQSVRVTGVMAKHRSFDRKWCAGAGLTPVPVPVRVPDYTRAGDLDGKTLDRWDFLSLPLVLLLHTTRAIVNEVAEPDFAGSVHATTGRSMWQWIVRMPIGGDVLDHDLTVRGLLAAAHGIDISDWPSNLAVREA